MVTALFCDLVGFTALGVGGPRGREHDARRYFALARTQIESYGGTVEKFIGDAVVGVFGVPVAHEDDPERAVRAGLRIVEAAEELRGRRRPAAAPGRDRYRRGAGAPGVRPGSGEGDPHRRRDQHRVSAPGGRTGDGGRGGRGDVRGDAAVFDTRS